MDAKREFSKKEANEILRECRLLRQAIDRLRIKAMKALRPKLKLVD